MDDERRGGIDVTDYACTLAYLRAASSERTGEILARRGLTRAAWQTAADAWARALEEEMARGEHRLLLTYAAALRSARRRLAEDPAALETIERIAVLPALAYSGPVVVAPEPASASGLPAPPVVRAALASTAPLDIHAIISKGLPFARSADPAAARRALPPVVEAARIPTGTLMSSKVKAAAPLPFGAGSGAADAPRVAHGGGAAPGVPQMSFEQYVALCAEMTVFPTRVDGILAKARVPRALLAELHAVWRERLAADAELAGRWHPLYAHYQAWFSKPP